MKVPVVADPEAPPKWVPLSTAPSYTWHEHRIHWMSPIPPPAARGSKGKPHHIFAWHIAGTIDDQPLRISGSLDWIPGDGSSTPILLIVVAAAGGAALIGVVPWMLRRRRGTRGHRP